jgi:DNA-binding CsgD family transcriptional regulator
MEWARAAGELVEAIGTPRFGSRLSQGLRQITPFDYLVIFGYVGASRPLDLYDDFPPQRRRLHVEEYQEGPYLLDPFFLAAIDMKEPGLFRLREIAPDRFYQGEYYRSYYAQTGLAEEIGYLIRIDEKMTMVVSLMRKAKSYTAAELKALKRVWPIVEAACRKNWQGVSDGHAAASKDMEGHIEAAFRSVGEGVLTPRERQVVELTLRGYSAEAIGRILEISPGTVRIHRRNIYTKLRIRSQGELFSLFLEGILGRARK